MKIYKCEKCGSTDIFIECNENNHGLYCGDCGKWIKWLNRDEERLALRQIINQQSKSKNEESIKSDDRIVTIQKSSTCAVTCAMTEFNRATWEETAKKKLCESIASELSQYISFEVEEDNRPCFTNPHMTVTATIKVIDLNREEHK